MITIEFLITSLVVVLIPGTGVLYTVSIGLRMFQEALRLHPRSPIALIEYANGLVMLEGEEMMDEATRLYEQAAALQPLDAMERLDVELARAELEA